MTEKNREFLDWVKKLMAKYDLQTTLPSDKIKQINIYFESETTVEITGSRELWYGVKLKEMNETERILL